MSPLGILLLLVGLVALMSAANPTTRATALKILGGLAIGGLLLSAFFFVQARQRAEQEASHVRWVDEHAAIAHAVGHEFDVHSHAASGGHASHARPVVATWSKLVLVVVALGLVILLAREHTRAAGIKTVLALVVGVMLFGIFFYRGTPNWQWEYEREWDWSSGHRVESQSEHAAPLSPHGPSTPTPSPTNTATDHVAPTIATPAPQPLPTSSPDVPQSPTISDGRPPEPAEGSVAESAPKIVAEREPEAAPAANVPAAQPAPAVTTATSEQRPAWVDLPARREGDVYIVVANSGPFVTDQECAEALAVEARKVAGRVIDDLIGPGTAAFVQSDQEYARRLIERVSKEQFSETRSTSVGPMKILHVRMEFDEQVKADLKNRWRQAQLETRLAQVSGVALWVLALVGSVYAFLKVDTATKGYYTKRLQVAAAVVILTIIVLGLSA